MAPKSKSHSAKPASGFKAKSASKIKQELLKSRKSAVSFSMKKNDKKNIEQQLKGRKPAVSPSAKVNLKKVKQELLKGRKPAASSSEKENYNAQLKKLEAENNALRKTLAANSKEHAMNMIPRPEKGNAGKGYNLQEAMGLADDDETYAFLRRSVRDLAAQAGLDCSILWYRQPKDVISKIIGAARQRHSYFKRFPHGWAIEEFLKTNLKNKRTYARKRGYLGDQTNRGVESEEGNIPGNDGASGDENDGDERASDSDQGTNGTGKDNGGSDSSQSEGDDDIDEYQSTRSNERRSASNVDDDIDDSEDIY